MGKTALQEEVKEKGISVVVASNPRNPTGQAIEGHELESLVQMSRKGTTVILDEVRTDRIAWWCYWLTRCDAFKFYSWLVSATE
jgi:bifunctional pyridoxal-dependent enzyme with beta-cystathionase and maltose regulon repressor activities